MSADKHNKESKSNELAKPYNWDHPDAGFVPEDTINLIFEFDEIEEGIAHISKITSDEFKKAGGEMNDEGMIGLMEDITHKFAVYTSAHRSFEEYIKKHRSETILPLKKEHKESGVDVRTDDNLYNLKYSESVDTIELCREGWVMNPITDFEKEITLVCITKNGKIMKKRHSEKEGEWEVLT